jgi:hypothetical protein
MRTGWEPDAHQAIFDVGALGCRVSGGHGHADLLAFQCWAFGQPFVVDPGTGVYTGEARWRDHFRGTAAHATVMVDGRGQAEPAGPFKWRDRPAARLHLWRSGAGVDVAEGEHGAYGRLPDPVIHRRRVIFVKPRYWAIVDDLAGDARHRIELRFPLAPLQATIEDGGWTRAVHPGGRTLLLRAFAAIPLTARLARGSLDPIEGWVSSDYGQREAAPVLVYAAEARLPFRIATLLAPSVDAGSPPPEVGPLPGPGGAPEGLLFANGETLRFEETP